MGIRDILLNGPLGFGAAPLGNMFRDIPDHEAEATVDAAREHGTRYFDTAPMYGAGLAEIRLGKYLAQHDRDDYVLSTKVGRLVLDEIDTKERHSEMFKFGRANRVVYDYSEKGALKSIEGSLNRLGMDRLDFVFVHDPAQDFHGHAWLAQLETARTGAFRALARLREVLVTGADGGQVPNSSIRQLIWAPRSMPPPARRVTGHINQATSAH